jgi:hypothetical protein
MKIVGGPFSYEERRILGENRGREEGNPIL